MGLPFCMHPQTVSRVPFHHWWMLGIFLAAPAAKSQTAWTNRFEAPAKCQNVPAAITLGSNGNVYVTGYSYLVPGVSNSDYATIAYSREGSPLWTNRYDGPDHNLDS